MDDYNTDDLDFGIKDSDSSPASTEEGPQYLDKVKDGVTKVKEKLKDNENVKVTVAKARKITKGNDFAMVYYANVSKMLAKGELKISKTEIQIMFKLLEYTQLGNLLSFSQTQIAKELGIAKQSVNRSLKRLREADLILNTGRGVFLNPLIVCKGSFESVMGPITYARANNKHQYDFNFEEPKK